MSMRSFARLPSAPTAVVVALLLVLAACGVDADGGRAEPPPGSGTVSTGPAADIPSSTSSSTTTTTGAARPTTTSSWPRLTRDEVRSAVDAGLGEEPITSPEQVDCYTDHLISEVGLDRLTDLGVGRGDLFSSVLLGRATRDLDLAERFFAPMFDCLDMRAGIIEDLQDVPADSRDCVADAVIGHRRVRLIFIIGTKKGSSPDPDLEAMFDPLVEQFDAIVAACSRSPR